MPVTGPICGAFLQAPRTLRKDGGGSGGDGVNHCRTVGQDDGDGQGVRVDDVQQSRGPHVHVSGAQRARGKLRLTHGVITGV